MHTFPFLLLLLLIAGQLGAQAAAPDFLCTRSEAGGEILSWSNTANDCGAYRGTEIYRAESAEGPYTLLTTLTDPSATEYRDENPRGLQLFYYLQYDYDCPGQTVMTSDTLDSFIPVTPDVHFVSVVDGDLVINWAPSPSPEVNRYVILEVTDNGIFPVDTVGQVTSYTITGVPADELTDRHYRVAALDACGNDSPQSSIVTAFDLTGSGGTGCTSDIELVPLQDTGGTITTLSPTEGDTVQLFVSVNGGDYTPDEFWTASSFTDTIPNYGYTGANDGDSLCFYFEIDYPDIELNQRTVVYCQTVDIFQPVREFPLYGVEVGDDGRLRFAYEYPDPPPATYTTELQQPGTSGVNRFPEPAPNLLDRRETITSAPVAATARDSFRFVLTDECDRTGTTNYVSPVVLAAAALNNGAVELTWSPLENGLAGGITYTVYRLAADSTLLPLATDLSATTFIDNGLPADDLPCYRVEAVFQPEGSTVSYTFRSNLACAARPTEIYLPNAFSPTADREVNRVFRPIFTNPTDLTDYRLRVYDRWGGLMFLGEDPQAGWDGMSGGRAAPAGSYVYVLTFTSARGNLVERSGVVHLLY